MLFLDVPSKKVDNKNGWEMMRYVSFDVPDSLSSIPYELRLASLLLNLKLELPVVSFSLYVVFINNHYFSSLQDTSHQYQV